MHLSSLWVISSGPSLLLPCEQGLRLRVWDLVEVWDQVNLYGLQPVDDQPLQPAVLQAGFKVEVLHQTGTLNVSFVRSGQPALLRQHENITRR